MNPVIDLDDEYRRAPASYLAGMPEEFIRPAVIAELEYRIVNLRQALEKIANYGERTQDNKPNPNKIFVQAYNPEIFVIAREALKQDLEAQP